MNISRSPSLTSLETPVAELGTRNGEETSLLHLLRGPVSHRDVDQILGVNEPDMKQAIFNSAAMKQYLGITANPAPMKQTSSSHSRIARSLLKRIGATFSTSPPKQTRNHVGDHQRKPELLATAALNLESPADAKRALKLLGDHLEQNRNSGDLEINDWARKYSQLQYTKSVEKALTLLLENVARIPVGINDDIRNNIRNDIMDIVLDNKSALGERSAEKIDAALKQVEAANVRRVSPRYSDNDRYRKRIFRTSAATDDSQESVAPVTRVNVAGAPRAESRRSTYYVGNEEPGALSPTASASSPMIAAESQPALSSSSKTLNRSSTFNANDAEEVIKNLSEDHTWDIDQFKRLRTVIRAFITDFQPARNNLETSMKTFQSYIGSSSRPLTRIADIRVLDTAVEAFITKREAEVAEDQNTLVDQEARHDRLSARPSFVLARGESGKAQFDTAKLKEFVRQTDRIRPFTRRAIDFWSPADVPLDGIAGIQTDYRDQHYSDSANSIKLFDELFTEGRNAPLKIIPNEANLPRNKRSDQQKDNTCGIITLLQHATGDYGFRSHSAEASEIRERMEQRYPEVAQQTTLELDTSIPYMGWLLDEIERRHKKRLDLHVVQINSEGEPFIQKPVGESRGEKVVVLNKGAHYEALVFNNDQITPEDKQRLAFELVNGYTNRRLGKHHPFGETPNQRSHA